MHAYLTYHLCDNHVKMVAFTSAFSMWFSYMYPLILVSYSIIHNPNYETQSYFLLNAIIFNILSNHRISQNEWFDNLWERLTSITMQYSSGGFFFSWDAIRGSGACWWWAFRWRLGKWRRYSSSRKCCSAIWGSIWGRGQIWWQVREGYLKE